MGDIIIKAENLGKQFNIGALQKYDTLRDRLASVFKPKDKGTKTKEEDVIWALRDVNFEIKQGDVVGVIGRNGAGKSTLLKILSKITEPTVGRVELHGRVGSLLEVGTGFHPELTGRENVFLNGAILGMSRAEIKRRFDEIVAFSEVEKFIDTPVKHYSSGMYMRLAFAVAAYLEPEILLVDEVLAVGDAQFQKKCLGKMGEVAQAGRTVLFVSHNMSAVESLCTRAILLENGYVAKYNDANSIINYYISTYMTDKEDIRKKTNILQWMGVANYNELTNVRMDENIKLEFTFYAENDINDLFVDVAIHNQKEERIIHLKDKFINRPRNIKSGTKFKTVYFIKKPNLIQGKYFLTVYAYTPNEVLFWGEKIQGFYVSAKPCFGIAENFDGINCYIMPEYNINYIIMEK